MSRSRDDFKYVLMMKNDHIGYVWLKSTKDTTEEVAACRLIEWFSCFGVVNQWVSGRGTHFWNELVNQLRERVKSEHHFTLAYCHWSNVTVEVVCRELLRSTRALLSKYQLTYSSWPQIIPVAQSILNNALLERLWNRCPLTVFTGLPQDTPLLTIKRNSKKGVCVLTIDEVRARQKANCEATQHALRPHAQRSLQELERETQFSSRVSQS